jgi:hypothetical protein
MKSLDGRLIHLIGNRVLAITGESIHARSDQKVGSQLLRRAEQLEYIALAVSDMYAALRLCKQSGRLTQIFQPTKALLFLDRNPCRVDRPLQRIAALELFATPCSDPLKTCSGVILNGEAHEHVDGRRDQEMDRAP